MDNNNNNFGDAPELTAPVTDQPTKELAMVEIPLQLLARDEKGKEFIQVDISKLSASGAEAISGGRLKLPVLKLLNSTSGEVREGSVYGARAGLWYNDILCELHEEAAIIPLHFKVNRYLYAPGSTSDIKCMSLDGMGEFGIPKVDNEELLKLKLSPIPFVNVNENGKELTVGQCHRCPNKDFGENNEKPPCQKVTFCYGVYATLLDEDNLANVEAALINPSDIGEILGMCFGIPFRGAGGELAVGKIRNASIFTGGVYGQSWRLFASLQRRGSNSWFQPEINPYAKLSDRQKRAANTLRMIVRHLNPIISVDSESNIAPVAPMESGAETVDVE